MVSDPCELHQHTCRQRKPAALVSHFPHLVLALLRCVTHITLACTTRCRAQSHNERRCMQGPVFLGENMSMADCAFVPFVERAAASLAYYKGWHMRHGGSAPSSAKRDEKSEGAAFPAVEAWLEALERRPTYLATRSDFYTHCHDLPPQLGGAPRDRPRSRRHTGL